MNLHNQEAEQSVLGACLLNNDVIDTVSAKLSAEHFYFPSNRTIWRAVIRLYNAQRPVDVVTLSEALEAEGEDSEAGGLMYVAEVARNTPSWKNATHYADAVIELHQRRTLASHAESIAGMVGDKSMTVSDIIDMSQGKLSSVVGASDVDIGPIGQYLNEFIDNIDAKWNGHIDPMGIGFGVKDLDSLTMGMHPSNLVLLGARPKMGKTLFGLNSLRTCALDHKRPAIMFSMEMSKQEILVRLTAAIGNMPQDAIKDPKQHMRDDHWPRLTLAVNDLKGAPIVIDDRPALTPSQIRGAAKRWKDHYGDMGLIVVDYVGLMKPEGKHGTREREVAEISGSLKALAKELGCPVLALSQLNRGVEQRPNKRPMMSDLRESGSLEQDADLIVFLYADEQYNPDTENKGVMELIVSAQRAGRTGTVYAARRLAEARIDDLAPEFVERAKRADGGSDDGFSV